MNEKIVFVGDICLANSGSHPPGLAAPLKQLVGGTPTLVGTIECPLADSGSPKPYKACLRAPASAIQALKGFHVGILGNNHIEDFGQEAAEATRKRLLEIGCLPVGYGDNYIEAIRPAIVLVGEARVAIVSLCCPTTRADGFATDRTAGIAMLSADSITEAVVQAKQLADIVIVCPHWGVQGSSHPCVGDMRLARLAIDAGAHAVIGTHAHVIQSSESYLGAPVIYGLGNYVFSDVDVRYVDHSGKLISQGLKVVQSSENKRSLVVVLAPVQLDGRWTLRVDARYIAEQGQDCSHRFTPIEVTNEDRQFLRLKRLLPLDLDSRSPASYRCTVRQNIAMMNHIDPPLGRLSYARALLRRMYDLSKTIRARRQA